MNLFSMLVAIVVVAIESIPGGHVVHVEKADPTQEYRVRASMGGGQNFNSPWYPGKEVRQQLTVSTTDSPSTPTRIMILSRTIDSQDTPTQTLVELSVAPSRDLIEAIPIDTSYIDVNARPQLRTAVRAMMQAQYLQQRDALQREYRQTIIDLQARYYIDPKNDPYRESTGATAASGRN